MNPARATFIGIGAQKCATTWLHGVLAQSADVRMTDEKEVDFFSYYFDRGYEWYSRGLADPSGGETRRHRGEISPSYLIHPDAPGRAAAYNPGMHVFLLLRDPVERAFSNHLHEVRKGHVTGANTKFEAGMANNPLYLDQSLYARHLDRWLDHFPSERIHVLFQEEIRDDREGAARQVTDWLGVAPLNNFVDRRANESVRYRNPAIGRTLWRLGKAARDRGLGRPVEALKKLPGIRHLREANRQGVRDEVAPIEPETEARMIERFVPDVERLRRQLGRDVPWPRFSKG